MGVDLAVIEYVTPYKICVAALLHEYIYLKCPKFRRENNETLNDDSMSESEDRYINSVEFDPLQRKDFCRLLLTLIQNVDMSLAQLSTKILANQDGFEIHQALKVCWKRKLVSICEDPVSGLMSVMSDYDRLLCDSPVLPYLHRLSVCGLFIRRILLGFEKLSFTEVSNFAAIFKQYCCDGLTILLEYQPEISSQSELSALVEFTQEMNKSIGKILTENRITNARFNKSESKWSQKQSDFYVSKQVALLQSSESNADSPKKVEDTVKKIISDNPDLSQVHYLAYLNALRTNDYCTAVKSLYWSFDRSCQCESFLNPEMDTDKLSEEVDRGFRYAALNLAALHANFQHKSEAISALKEAIMMAQESNDHLCLQHALTWLFRVQPENQHLLMQRCISKCNALGLSYLTSLGIQSLAQVVALSQEIKGSPATVMDNMSKSDLLNCQHSLTELILTGYAQKASFWTMYGRGQLSCIISQLLLNIDSSDPSRDHMYVTGEANAIALANIAKRLYDQGYSKECDLVLEFAKSLFPRESSLCGSIWRSTQIQIEFLRALHQTDWTTAEHCIKHSLAFSKHRSEPLFLKLQLFLAQGNDQEAAEICEELVAMHEKLSELDKVRSYLYQAEVFCLSANYPDAIVPLMSAMKISNENKLEYFHALVTLHTAHVQLQLGMHSRALSTVQSSLPMILGHGSLFESSRARVLYSKCLVASNKGCIPTTYTAIGHLRKAFDDFMLLRAHLRAKDVLYLMARLFHMLGKCHDRNQVSAELKRLEDQYTTNGASQLAIML